MKKLPPALVYTVLRLLAFFVPFGLLMLLPIFHPMPWLAAIFAALIGLALSMLFLRRPLTDVSTSVYERRERARAQRDARETPDEDVEDTALDG